MTATAITNEVVADVAATMAARLAGERFSGGLADGSFASMDSDEAFSIASAAAANPAAAFAGVGVDAPGAAYSATGTRDFFMRRFYIERERLESSVAEEDAEAETARRDGITLSRYARAAGLSFEDVQAAAILGDRSQLRKCEELLAYS